MDRNISAGDLEDEHCTDQGVLPCSARGTDMSSMQPKKHEQNGILGLSESQPNPNIKCCSFCEVVKEVKYHCNWCQYSFCNRCRRCHDKLCGQNARLNTPALEDLQLRFNEFSQTFSSLQASGTFLMKTVIDLTSSRDWQSKESQTLVSLIDTQKSEIQSMQQKLLVHREENASLKQSVQELEKNNSCLNQTVMSLRDDYATLDLTIGTLKKENYMMQEAYGSLQQEVNQVSAAQRANRIFQKSASPGEFDDSQAQADISKLQNHMVRIDSELQSLREEHGKTNEACGSADYIPKVAHLQAVVSRLEEEISEMKKSSSATGFSASAAAADVFRPRPGSSGLNIASRTTQNTMSVGFWGKSGATNLTKERSPSTSSIEKDDDDEEEEEDDCPVCLGPVIVPKLLSCGHTFCTSCIDRALAVTPRCPKCQHRYGIERGTQPQNGTMVHSKSNHSLPGYEHCGTIVINYNFPGGSQEKYHPNPGRFYHGTRRTAYLPDNKEGRQVLGMLYKAFSHRLTFTIGTSVTTGATGVITWNDIHHKTNMVGGPANFGYPDPEYLARVKSELADKGIFPS